MAASEVPGVDAVWVATDDEAIAAHIRAQGGTVVMTAPDHPSGTDRVAEAAGTEAGRSFDVIVNFQADEPFLPPGHVAAAIGPVVDGSADVATLATPFVSDQEWASDAEVKVVRATDGRALYFSRAGVPWREEKEEAFAGAPDSPWLRHLGLYVYTRRALEQWVALPPSPLERLERLEQLRPLDAGLRMHVSIVGPCEAAIEEPEDLEWAERLLLARANQ